MNKAYTQQRTEVKSNHFSFTRSFNEFFRLHKEMVTFNKILNKPPS